MTSALDRFPARLRRRRGDAGVAHRPVFLRPGRAGGFLFGFLIALILAALHVVFLAVPIHALLSRRRTPGPVLVLAASFLIGALPLPLLLGVEELSTGFLIFGLLGMSGGIAFLLMAARATTIWRNGEADPGDRRLWRLRRAAVAAAGGGGAPCAGRRARAGRKPRASPPRWRAPKAVAADRMGDLAPVLAACRPDLVIDAAGPFQASDYRVPRGLHRRAASPISTSPTRATS